ncbi:hypothetical protein [Clostridium sp.]|uniref:hypothetical protein n=1 Tax=Clostridium sp. TaxID=1506 RepID=UPI003F67F427
MFTLKAFISISAMQDNDHGVVSALGELSDHSNSFAREKYRYTRQASPECELVVFDSSVTLPAPTPAIHVTKSLEYSQWCYTQAVTGKIGSDTEAFKAKFLAEFGGQIDRFDCGQMVTARGLWLPAFISYRLVDQEDNHVRLWFADKAFQAQYDSYQIIVIPPILPVDTFMNTTSVVAKALADFNLPQHQFDINVAAGGVPYTRSKTNNYTWYAPDDPTSTLTTYWSVIVYGGSVVNDDIIRDAIADHILNNSEYNRDQWLPVFPDIFASRGFTIIPNWLKHSTYDASPRGSLYSPVLTNGEGLEFANKYSFDRSEAHNLKYMQTSVVQWKSLAAVFVGNVENDAKRMLLTDVYEDYTFISPLSMDFNRMSFETTEFVKMLIKATIMAEEFDEYMILEDGFYKLERNGLFYITFNHLKVDFMVLTRLSMEKDNE